jgi:hypothetical protein
MTGETFTSLVPKRLLRTILALESLRFTEIPALRKRLQEARKRRERYHADETTRQAKIARQRAWNAQNKAKKADNDRRWREIHGAEATRRCRRRKKEQAA